MRKHKINNSLLSQGYTSINSLPLQGKEAAGAFTLVELIVVITILAIL
jgi:prepilin-type N-terminal cleavage/methylation domain-containing protein